MTTERKTEIEKAPLVEAKRAEVLAAEGRFLGSFAIRMLRPWRPVGVNFDAELNAVRVNFRRRERL